MVVLDLILGAIGGTVGSGIAAVLARSLLNALLSKDLERFKAKLNAQYDVELERLRADLRVAASERETRFTRLHDRRVDVLSHAYTLQYRARRAAGRLATYGVRAGEEGLADFVSEVRALADHFAANSYWMPESLRDSFSDVLRVLDQAIAISQGSPDGSLASYSVLYETRLLPRLHEIEIQLDAQLRAEFAGEPLSNAIAGVPNSQKKPNLPMTSSPPDD